MTAKLHFHGGAGVVTGANYLLEVKRKKILVDCGLFQGGSDLDEKNHQPFPYKPKEIDFVLITHAHLDHIGRLPKLIEDGFEGQIFATAPTIDFARLMLEDSQKLLNEKAAKAGVIPLIDGSRIEGIMEMFKIVDYDQPTKLTDGISICYRDAGHVLGSAIIEVGIDGKKIAFSGDLGSGNVPLLKKTALIKDVDYLVMESTYGDRLHETTGQVKDRIEDVAEETVGRGGVLMIPSFALERTQQLLYHFNDLAENNRIPRVPIFLDSPLAIKLTRIYQRYPQYFTKEADSLIKAGDDIFKFPGLRLTLSVSESKGINDIAPPKIIIAGSGMSQGGRIIHHEARYLSDPNNTLLIVTYQAKGTVGRQILDGAKKVRILDKIIPVKAKIERIDGYSSHADQEALVNWVKAMVFPSSSRRPKKVFCCQGEEEPANILAQEIKDHLGLSAEVPQEGQIAELSF